MIAAFRTAGKILSARGLLAVSLFGAFILAMVAVIKGGVLPLVGLAIYAVLTIIPIVALEIRKR